MSIKRNNELIAGRYAQQIIPYASNTVAGIIRIATDAEITVAPSSTTAVVPTQLNAHLALKQNNLTAGSNIQISNDTISATDTTYTAGDGLTLSGTEFTVNVEDNLTSTSSTNSLSAKQGNVLNTNIDNHKADKNNPHEVTKAQVGLGNCDNTSDINKPISTATQTALNLKQDNLTAGSNIQISDQNVISATNTIYTAGNGLTLTGTEFTANVTNNVTSSSTTNALSANMGKELQDQISNLKARGRFLSEWNSTTGLPETNPTTLPYTYETGSYFIVGTVGATNYKPTGSQYTGAASTTIETENVAVNDTYLYDGSVWKLLHGADVQVTFASIAGQPTDNSNLASALNAKQDALTAGNLISITNNTVAFTGTIPEKLSDLIDDTVTNPIDKADTLTGLTATVTELNYTDGVTSNIQTQLNSKQDIIQYSTMPTATQATAGDVIEYIGTTTSSYTHGYVYEGIYSPENVTAVQTAGQLELGDITTNLATFKAAMGSNLAVGTYLFKFVGYPTQIVATNSSTSATISLTRETAQDTGDAYAWIGSDSVIYFTNTKNAQIGTVLYDTNLAATAYSCTSITARSTTVNLTGVWVLGDSDTNIQISDYGIYSPSTPVVGTIISATYSLASSYWQQLNVQPVKEVIQTMSAMSSNTVTVVEGTSIYTKTIAAATTFTFDVSNLGSLTNKAVTFELYLDMSGSAYTLTFPSTVTWIGTTPTFSSTGKYLLAFKTLDGGSTWIGNVQHQW